MINYKKLCYDFALNPGFKSTSKWDACKYIVKAEIANNKSNEYIPDHAVDIKWANVWISFKTYIIDEKANYNIGCRQVAAMICNYAAVEGLRMETDQ